MSLVAFVVTATVATTASSAAATTYTGGAITIVTAGARDATPVKASPYPSTIAVSGFSGTVTDVDVVIAGLAHTKPQDVDVLLVGPTGAGIVVLSDAGNNAANDGVTLTFSDEAAGTIPTGVKIATGTYDPTNSTDGAADADVFPAPATSATGTALSVFDGTDPNGTWSLYVTDDATNANGSITSWSLEIAGGAPPADTTAPTVTVDKAAGQADPTNAGPVLFDVVFSEPVTGFDATDVDLADSTVSGTLVPTVTGSGASYQVSVAGATGQGDVVAAVGTGAAVDGAGNGNTTSSSTDNSVAFDDEAPTVTIEQAAAQADPTNAGPVLFSVTFSEDVTGFAGDDVDLGSSTVGGTLAATVTGTGTTYEVSVGGATGTGVVTAAIGAGAAVDAAGNASAASTSSDATVAFDADAPSVTVDEAATQDDPATSSPITFTVVFSETVTGFAATDVDLSTSTAPGTLVADVTGSGPTYTVSVSGMTAGGTVVATIAAGAATDGTGNASSASTSTDNAVSYEPVGDPPDPPARPTATIEQGATQSDPVASGPVTFDVEFSEAVTGFTDADVDLSASTAGGTLAAAVSGSGTTYTVSVSGVASSGAVVASIPANAAEGAAGGLSQASASVDNSVTVDLGAPTVTIDQDAGQADPTGASPIEFDVVFSEAVTGFDADDIAFTGSTVPGTIVASVSGSGATYTVLVSGMSGEGTVVASIGAGGAADGVGNASAASTSTDATVLFDSVQPIVTIDQAAGQADPAFSSPVAFDVVFSEPVTGFGTTSVSLADSTAATGTVTVTGGPATYVVTVGVPAGSSGTVVADVTAGGGADAAGNPSVVSTSTDNSVSVAVASGGGAVGGGGGSGPRPPVDPPEASASDAAVDESVGGVRLVIVLSEPLELPATLAYAAGMPFSASDDATASATPGQDFVAASDQVLLAPGTESVEIEIPIVDDDEVEEPEAFTVQLEASGMDLTDGSAVVTIIDNDADVLPAPPTRRGSGYWLLGADGGVFAFGIAPFLGAAPAIDGDFVAMTPTPTGFGYWLVDATGAVYAFGDALHRGGLAGAPSRAVSIVAHPSGLGYWIVTADGGVTPFGAANALGSLAGVSLNRPIVAAAVTPSGAGYWLVASDGGVFAFGDARYAGSTGGIVLNKPIVAADATPSGLGYWLVASDGGVFAFGDAGYFGSTGGMALNQPVLAGAANESGDGYWLFAADGGVFAFGVAAYHGSTGGLVLNRPITAATAA